MTKRIVIVWFTVVAAFQGLGAQYSFLESALVNNNLDSLKTFVRANPVNGYYGKKQVTPLSMAVLLNKPEGIKYLLKKGADPDQFSSNFTPLMYAVIQGNKSVTELLLLNDANVNIKNSGGNTALIYAAGNGHTDIVRLLLSAGASAELKNDNRQDALHFARLNHHAETAYILRAKLVALGKLKSDAFYDGPHVFWINPEKFKASFYRFDPKNYVLHQKIHTFRLKNEAHILQNPFFDTAQYRVPGSYEAPESTFNGIDEILVIGDIHGSYMEFKELLINNAVMDGAARWTFEKGHLVLLGDLLDRGDGVTESLWLIQDLSRQASDAGGKVHFLLGNHEIMTITGDHRYISDKYFILSQKTQKNYFEFFSIETELGRFLRNQNTIVKINDLIFVHGGISPSVLNLEMPLPLINEKIRLFLSGQDTLTPESREKLIFGPESPFWYRGYLFNTPEFPGITRAEVDQTLQMFDAQRIIFAHTEGDHFRFQFGNRLICVDVPMRSRENIEKALLISNNQYYLIYQDGSRKILDLKKDIPKCTDL